VPQVLASILLLLDRSHESVSLSLRPLWGSGFRVQGQGSGFRDQGQGSG